MSSLESLVPSLPLCRQLQAAGFPQDTAMVWYPIESPDKDGDKTEFVFISGEGIDAICAAPTAGELMQWLVAKGWDISIGKPHDKVLVDAASMKLNQRIPTDADTIPDALGEVILAVLAKEAEHD